MRIAFLSPVGVIGGAERLLLDYAVSLQQAEPAVELALVTGADGPLVRQAEELGMKVFLRPLPAALARLGDSALLGGAAKPRAGAGGAGGGGWSVDLGIMPETCGKRSVIGGRM